VYCAVSSHNTFRIFRRWWASFANAGSPASGRCCMSSGKRHSTYETGIGCPSEPALPSLQSLSADCSGWLLVDAEGGNQSIFFVFPFSILLINCFYISFYSVYLFITCVQFYQVVALYSPSGADVPLRTYSTNQAGCVILHLASVPPWSG